MKLFGGNKHGKHVAEAENTSELIEEVIPAVQVPAEDVPAAEVTVPEISTVSEIEEPVQAAPATQEDGYISSIAEAFGISPEEMQTEAAVSEDTSSGAMPVMQEAAAGKKLTRAEKKAAKAQAKADAKAAKAEAKRAAKEAKKWSAGKRIVFAVVLLFALSIVGFAGYFVSEMWVGDEQLDIYEADFSGEIIRNEDEDVYANSTEPQAEDESNPIDSTRKKGCYTFLVAARDVASGCTDVIICGMFDTEKDTITMVSIPRDTMINKGNLKVNTAYQGNLAAGGNGIDGLLREMKKLLGFDIDSYAIVDVTAVEKLIDAIGGVYFDVPMDMKYTDGKQGLVIDIKKGYQKLSGSDAVKLLRFRKGYINGDLGRIETQHDFIMAMAEQMLDVGNIPNLGAAIDIYQTYVQSNLTAGNILFYAKNFLEMDMENIKFVDMPQMRGGMVDGQSFIFINPNKWVNTINEYLNPYKDDITQRNLNIKSSADEGQTFFYTGGQG